MRLGNLVSLGGIALGVGALYSGAELIINGFTTYSFCTFCEVVNRSLGNFSSLLEASKGVNKDLSAHQIGESQLTHKVSDICQFLTDQRAIENGCAATILPAFMIGLLDIGLGSVVTYASYKFFSALSNRQAPGSQSVVKQLQQKRKTGTKETKETGTKVSTVTTAITFRPLSIIARVGQFFSRRKPPAQITPITILAPSTHPEEESEIPVPGPVSSSFQAAQKKGSKHQTGETDSEILKQWTARQKLVMSGKI